MSILADLTGEEATTEQPSGDDALFIRLRDWVKAGQRHWAEWRKEAEECYRFVAGDHWTETDKQAFIASGRQPIVFNRVGPIVDAISGMEVNNRQEVSYRPRTMGDVTKNEMASGLAKWARDEAQAEDEESDAFIDVLICGIGSTETRMDYSNGDGSIAIDRTDPLEVGIDPAARKRNAVDRRYSYRVRTIPAADAQAMFPGLELQAINAAWASAPDIQDGGEGNKSDYPAETRAALQGKADPKDVTLVEIEWYDTVTEHVVAVTDLDGNVSEQIIAAEDFQAAKERLDALGFQHQSAKRQRRVYRYAVLGASGIIDQADRECFQREFITGKRDSKKKTWYGIVRAMRDPSMLANKVLSQILHILNSNAKGGLLYEEDAFVNVKQAEKDWSNPQKSIRLVSGALAAGKLKERTPPPMPQVLAQLLEYAISAIPDVTGVNVEVLGLADRDQPASLEMQRRQSAITILAPFFDSLRRYRKNQGAILLKLLRFLPPGTMVRITMDEQDVYAPFDPTAFQLDDDSIRYDIIVDEAPSAPDQKAQVWQTLSQMMNQGLEVPPEIMAALLEYSPLPKSVSDKIAGMINQMVAKAQAPQLPPPAGPVPNGPMPPQETVPVSIRTG